MRRIRVQTGGLSIPNLYSILNMRSSKLIEISIWRRNPNITQCFPVMGLAGENGSSHRHGYKLIVISSNLFNTRASSPALSSYPLRPLPCLMSFSVSPPLEKSNLWVRPWPRMCLSKWLALTMVCVSPVYTLACTPRATANHVQFRQTLPGLSATAKTAC